MPKFISGHTIPYLIAAKTSLPMRDMFKTSKMFKIIIDPHEFYLYRTNEN